ncbi:hypothetical protein GOV12_00770 [Candidatus Pacearchaeota archaeon]|nr:hypothetical protein [Candidatus Pacearchaeota archaeon]
MKVKLSVLWIFVMFNYIYADIMTLMDSSVLTQILSGTVGGLQLTPGFFLIAAIIMEIPIAMVILSLFLKYKWNRLANIIAGIIKTLAVIASMFVGTPALYYVFFGVIEIIFTSIIVIIAWKWKNPN